MAVAWAGAKAHRPGAISFAALSAPACLSVPHLTGSFAISAIPSGGPGLGSEGRWSRLGAPCSLGPRFRSVKRGSRQRVPLAWWPRRIGLQKAEMRHFAQQHLRTRMSEEGHQRRFKRKPRTSASPPIPDILLRRVARRPNRLTLRPSAADDGELRQAAGAAA